MNINKLYNTINTFGYSGNVLGNEDVVILQNSLLLLQNDNHFRKIYFWGRIFGVTADYFIAFGYIKDALSGHIYYYSMNGLDWGLLPKPSATAKLLAPLCVTRFQGDPTLVVDVYEQHAATEPFGTHIFKTATGVMRELKEEDRLSAIVEYINNEALIVPRGALFKRPDGVCVENISYEGLPIQEAKELTSYMHWRAPIHRWNTNILTRQDYNYALDFLDTIDKDIPKGCWSIKIHDGGSIAIVKSLYWQGMTFYQITNNSDYGSIYIGAGRRNLDLPHMLPKWE